MTSTPAEANPAVIAASRNSPEARVSRPTNALGRSERCGFPKILAAARPKFTTELGVSGSRFAAPRMPSVPKSLRDTSAKLAGRRRKRNTKDRIRTCLYRAAFASFGAPLVLRTCAFQGLAAPKPFAESGFAYPYQDAVHV